MSPFLAACGAGGMAVNGRYCSTRGASGRLKTGFAVPPPRFQTA
ncbi:hypothetical protein [Kingella potus]|nr:hypothetical protein [Kingella potus]